ncbi:MAG: hypothetical protein VSS75_027970 [Candidatus Parabeggiatoa sp.]|nr:hypothetical protein [Candidatus Parabeggiatoa sp.]
MYSYIIQLVSLVSIAYLASRFWLPETQILLWTTALLILLNYSLSLSNLFKNLRKYVKDEWKDELCPNPETFQTPVRKNQACLDWI